MGNFNLIFCFVVRPVASDVPAGGEIVLFKVLTYFGLFCIKIYCQCLSLRLLH